MFLNNKIRIRAFAGILFVLSVAMTGCQSKELTNKYVNRNEASVTSDNISIESINKVETFSNPLAIMTRDFTNKFTMDGSAAGELLLVNNDTNEVLYSDNSLEQTAMASTTKLMTAYIVLSKCNLDDVVTVKNNIVLEEGAVSLYLQPGDKISVDMLLNALLIESANDCAVVLGEHISGDVDSFVELMNDTAKEIGATHSHFSNPHGLDAKGHYSCAYDLYLIMKKDLEFDYFKEIVNTQEKTIKYINNAGDNVEVNIETTNQYFQKHYDVPEGIVVVGGKTGTTTNAGHCLVLSVENSKKEHLIGVVLNATDKNSLYETMSTLICQNN